MHPRESLDLLKLLKDGRHSDGTATLDDSTSVCKCETIGHFLQSNLSVAKNSKEKCLDFIKAVEMMQEQAEAVVQLEQSKGQNSETLPLTRIYREIMRTRLLHISRINQSYSNSTNMEPDIAEKKMHELVASLTKRLQKNRQKQKKLRRRRRKKQVSLPAKESSVITQVEAKKAVKVTPPSKPSVPLQSKKMQRAMEREQRMQAIKKTESKRKASKAKKKRGKFLAKQSKDKSLSQHVADAEISDASSESDDNLKTTNLTTASPTVSAISGDSSEIPESVEPALEVEADQDEDSASHVSSSDIDTDPKFLSPINSDEDCQGDADKDQPKERIRSPLSVDNEDDEENPAYFSAREEVEGKEKSVFENDSHKDIGFSSEPIQSNREYSLWSVDYRWRIFGVKFTALPL